MRGSNMPALPVACTNRLPRVPKGQPWGPKGRLGGLSSVALPETDSVGAVQKENKA
jgi:hypothetical protein